MNLREATMTYGRLAVFNFYDSAEIWGVRYGLTLVIGTLKIMASSGVFVCVVCALKQTIKVFSSPISMILLQRRDMQSCSSQKYGLNT
jgi:hypothetical protein